MRPIQQGGWIAEGADEQIAIAQSLRCAGELDLLKQLGDQLITSREVVLNRHPEWAGRVVSDTFINMLAEDDWEAARFPSQSLLPLTSEQAIVVEGALKNIANRWTGRKTGVEKPYRKAARAMIQSMAISRP